MTTRDLRIPPVWPSPQEGGQRAPGCVPPTADTSIDPLPPKPPPPPTWAHTCSPDKTASGLNACCSICLWVELELAHGTVSTQQLPAALQMEGGPCTAPPAYPRGQPLCCGSLPTSVPGSFPAQAFSHAVPTAWSSPAFLSHSAPLRRPSSWLRLTLPSWLPSQGVLDPVHRLRPTQSLAASPAFSHPPLTEPAISDLCCHKLASPRVRVSPLPGAYCGQGCVSLLSWSLGQAALCTTSWGRGGGWTVF